MAAVLIIVPTSYVIHGTAYIARTEKILHVLVCEGVLLVSHLQPWLVLCIVAFVQQ